MYIKIYFDEKPVYLCDLIDGPLTDVIHHPDSILIEELSTPAINSLLHEIKKPAFHAGVLLHPELETLKKAFFKHFTAIEAAGGIVQNDEGDILFIFRLGKWDLPKGKVEKGEDLQTCAVREVEEETNVSGVSVVKKAGETYHTYHAYGKHFIKTTHWYEMVSGKVQKLVPQQEEDITAIKWVKRSDIGEPLSNTYASIRDIAAQFLGNNKAI